MTNPAINPFMPVRAMELDIRASETDVWKWSCFKN